MELQKQIEVKRKIKKLFDDGINRDAVFNLIDELSKENVIVEGKHYIATQNAYESEKMLWKRANDNTYIFDKFLKLAK